MTSRTTDPGNVGELYDRLTDELTDALGGNIHFGYWRDERDHCAFSQAAEQMTDQLIARLDPRPDDTVLDIGCGIGTPAIRLVQERGARVVGISVSGHQVRRARERAAGLAGQARFELADAMDLPFPDASFDGAWAVESMLHMPDRGRVLREAARVLKPGGTLVISDFLRRGPLDAMRSELVGEFCEVSHIESIIDIGEYRALIERNGLTVLDAADITVHTRSSLAHMSTPLWDRREALAPVIGMDVLARIRRLTRQVDALPEIGYVLITARR